MVTAFSLFRICNVLYQVLATFVVYWINICSATIPPFLREWIWILFLVILFFCNLKHFKSYWQKRKQSRITFIVLIIVALLLSICISHSSISNMVIGIKYWFWWMFILLSAWFFGYLYSDKIRNINFLKWLPRILVVIVVLWFIFQWAKLLRPNLFYSMWYWRLDDYAYWENPPIYYLTGFEWILRRQWLFSWPNNYWYFLMAFLPIVRSFFVNNIKEKKQSTAVNVIALWIWFVAMILTLSRAVLVGCVIVFCMIYRKQFKNHKKIFIWWAVLVLLGLICLSIMKRESTIWHITSKIDVLPEIISNPLWHWLWSSWPAVHYEWKFLPENYYFQIMLDIWTVWFLIWVISMFYIMRTQYKIVHSIKWDCSESDCYELKLLHDMQIWFLALLVMWLFLHVFEDSMVNYLFFTIYGIVLGSLSKNIRGELWWKIQLKNRLP